MKNNIVAYSFPILMCATPLAANANETVTYSYDAQGRLIGANHTGTGDNAGLAITYQYDLAGNRTAYVVIGSKNAGQQVVVVPINKFTPIPINP